MEEGSLLEHLNDRLGGLVLLLGGHSPSSVPRLLVKLFRPPSISRWRIRQICGGFGLYDVDSCISVLFAHLRQHQVAGYLAH